MGPRSYVRRVRRHAFHRLNARQVNLLLELAVIGAFATGLTSWAVGTGWNRWWTAAHAVFGLSLLVLAPAKLRGSVRGGMRRRRPTRWLSASFGVLVLTVVGLGVAHATGLWHGYGYWSALWTHFLAAFALVPLFVWHLRLATGPGQARRPRPPLAAGLRRRARRRPHCRGRRRGRVADSSVPMAAGAGSPARTRSPPSIRMPCRRCRGSTTRRLTSTRPPGR